jgi:hypothetical protein
MHGQAKGRRELPVEMKFREGGDAAQRFQVKVTVEMLVNMVQHPLHPGMIVFDRCRHRLFLRGSIILAPSATMRSADLAV